MSASSSSSPEKPALALAVGALREPNPGGAREEVEADEEEDGADTVTEDEDATGADVCGFPFFAGFVLKNAALCSICFGILRFSFAS